MIKNFLRETLPSLKCDVLVVGAGPAGSGAALTAAQNGASTILVDKKKVIGSPIECGECISLSLLKEYNIKIDPRVIHAKHKGTVFWINKNIIVENCSPIWKSMSIDRHLFDNSLAYNAAIAGANLFVGAELIDAEISGDNITVATIKTDRREVIIEPKVVIAADGTFSTVGKFQNRKKLHKWEIGRTVSYEMVNLNLKYPDKVQMFFDDLTGVGYGYIIPKSKKSANVGLGRLGVDEHPWEHLEAFLELHPIVKPQIKNVGILEIKTGETPITGPRLELKKGNVLYAGDAAGQNLAHVGEGAIPSHICGRIAGEVASKATKVDDLSILEEYPKKISETIGPLLEECAEIRDSVVTLLASDMPPENKFLLGGLLISEVIYPRETDFIDELSKVSSDKVVSKVSDLIKKQGQEGDIQIKMISSE